MQTQDFVDAVNASPGDVALRLAFADWLDKYEDDPVLAAYVRTSGPVLLQRRDGQWSSRVEGDGMAAFRDQPGHLYLDVTAGLLEGFPADSYGDVAIEVVHGFFRWFSCSQDDWVRHVRQRDRLGLRNVARSHPLATVVFPGAEPEKFWINGRAFPSFPSFRWRSRDFGDQSPPSAFIHQGLYEWLEPLGPEYPTQRAAYEDLSLAALSMARKQKRKPDPKRRGGPRIVTK